MRRWHCLLGVLLAAVASGHPADIPSALAKASADGMVELRVKFDVLSFVLDAQPSELTESSKQALLDETPGDLQRRLDEAKGRFLVEGIVGAHLEFPSAEWVLREAEASGRRLPMMLTAVVRGRLVSGVSFKFPGVLGTVVLTVEMPYQEPYSEPVEAGQWSTALTLPNPTVAAVPAVKVVASKRVAEKRLVSFLNSDDLLYEVSAAAGKMPARPTAGTAVPPPASPPVATVVNPSSKVYVELKRPSVWQSLGRYVGMGFRHIVPEGLDHILFVLGLFLLGRRTKDLLAQVSCFTLAHSITLGLALYGVVRLPPAVVEPLIALSIVYVAVENIWAKEMRKTRLLVVFGFGLVHGLGFAGALQDTGLARREFLTALVGFNAGVELGQLSVIAAAFVLVGWLRSSPRYRLAVVVPASLAIAAVALVWTVERII